jgi:hypothetical protein
VRLELVKEAVEVLVVASFEILLVVGLGRPTVVVGGDDQDTIHRPNTS